MFYGFIYNTGIVAIAPCAAIHLFMEENSVDYRYIHHANRFNENGSHKILLVLCCADPGQLGRCMNLVVKVEKENRKEGERTAKSLLAILKNEDSPQGIDVIFAGS